MNIDDMQTGTHIEVESLPVPTLSIHRCAYECRLTKTEVKQTKLLTGFIPIVVGCISMLISSKTTMV